MNGLIETGLTIRKIVEPTLDAQPVDALAGQPKETLDRQLRGMAPRVLIVSAKKR